MGILDRLGNVIKSYINDYDGKWSTRDSEWNIHDSDLDAAYEELDEYLKGGNSTESGSAGTQAGNSEVPPRERPIPAELREDFAELGLSPDASAEDCKAAYKKLLKTHHPDRHAGDPNKMKKATEKTARINAAYRRLKKWFR